MTNGTLLNKKFARSMRRIPLKFLQLSIDGIRETHDRLREAEIMTR